MNRNVFGLVISSLFFLFLFSNVSYSQSANDAYKALKKVQARVQVGVSYKDYSSVIADAKAEVDLYLESRKSKENPQVANSLKKAMDDYMLAGEVWDVKFKLCNAKDIVYFDSEEGKIIRKIYPKAEIQKSPRINPHYYIPYILNSIWNDASQDLNRALSFLKD